MVQLIYSLNLGQYLRSVYTVIHAFVGKEDRVSTWLPTPQTVFLPLYLTTLYDQNEHLC